jgi:epoxyqueuosine reductase
LRLSNRILKELAASAGIYSIGVTSADPLYHLESRLKRRILENRITAFEESDPARRINPAHLLPGCKSIITIIIPYYSPLQTQVAFPGPRGSVAACARGLDYHRVVEGIAEKLTRLVEKESSGFGSFRILTDRSPLVERELARISGLGIIGENCTLINPCFGSYVVLGTILTDFEIEEDTPCDSNCLGCGGCRGVCPTGALIEPYILDPFRCLSYLTQASGIFPRQFRHLLGNRIYGCDSCQEVCPHNADSAYTTYPELLFHFFPKEPMLLSLLRITNSEFNQTIAMTSAGWRGKTTIQRNAVIAIGNSKDIDAVKPLTQILENDPRYLIRLHAAWSLGSIGGGKAKFALNKSLCNDPTPEVRFEARYALNHWNSSIK